MQLQLLKALRWLCSRPASADVATLMTRVNYAEKKQSLDPAMLALHVFALSAIKEGFDGVLFERSSRITNGPDVPLDPTLKDFSDANEASIENHGWRVRDDWCAYLLNNGHRAHELCALDTMFDSLVDLLAATGPSWQPSQCVHHTFVASDGKTPIDLAITATESSPILVTVLILNKVSKQVAESTLHRIYSQ